MKAKANLLFVFFLAIISLATHAQNFSNKGKLFYAGHMAHIGGTASTFALYITTEGPTTAGVRVSIPGGTYNQVFSVPVNGVTVVNLPANQTYINCTDCKVNNAVKIESLNHDLVVYAHIYNQNRSDATLLLPVQTWGKEYYAVAFTQNPVNVSSRSQLMVIASDDSTFVDITPTTALLPSRNANTTYTVMLNAGEAYHVQGANDVTGTKIVARDANGSSCKNVAAFSGSSFVRMGCALASSGDNLLQQLFPLSAWGNSFLTAPLKTRNGGDMFRILASSDSTSITLNNGTPFMLNSRQFYTFQSATDNFILADKPITVAQYPRTQNCDNVTGDPTLIVIPPIEQMVRRVTMYSSPYQDITGQYLNVITKVTDTSLFRLDNTKQVFTALANNSSYAVARITTTDGNHTLTSDSNFMAIAYGFGNFEAYGYAGGTNIKNLIQSIVASRDSVCLGDSIHFVADISYNPNTLIWHFGDGTTSSVRNPSKLYNAAGLYYVSLVTSKTGLTDCSSKDSTVYTIRVHDYPNASFSYTGNCLSDSIRFTNQSGANSSFSYLSDILWSFNDGSTSTQQNPSRKFQNFGNLNTQLIARNNFLCADTFSVLHFLNPNPQPILNVYDTCMDIALTYRDSGKIASGNVIAWNWLIDSLTTYNTQQISPAFTSVGKYRIDLEVTSDSGCKAQITDSVEIFNHAIAAFSVNNACLGYPQNILDSSVNATNKTWYINQVPSIATPPQLNFTTAGQYAISLAVSTDKGCYDSISKIVDVYPLPPSEWSYTGKCLGEEFRFTPDFDTTSFSGLQYQWYENNTPITQQAIWTKTYTTPGQYNIQLNTTSLNGCEASRSTTINVLANPTALPFYDAACEKRSGLLRNGGTGQTSQTWIVSSNSYNTPTANVIPDFDGQQATLIVFNDSGCTDTGFVNMSIVPSPKADFTISSPCPLNAIDLVSTSSSGTGDPITQHDWFAQGRNIGNNNQSSITFNQSGTYPIRLIVRSSSGCADTLIKNHFIVDIPSINIQKEDICAGDTAYISNQSAITHHRITESRWQFNNKAFVGDAIDDQLLQPGWYRFTLTILTDSGCVFNNIGVDSVRAYEIPQAAFVASPKLTSLRSPEISFTNRSLYATQWLWNFGNGQSSIEHSPIHRYTDSGAFIITLTVRNPAGCSNQISDTILIKPQLDCIIPNAFTPNFDNFNPVFLPYCEGFRTFQMIIWNRWGQEVYRTDHYKGWDGTLSSGAAAPDGVYIYQIILNDFNQDRSFKRGSVVLLR